MDRLSGKVIFSVGKFDYRWEEVLIAARRSSKWGILQENVRKGLACLKKNEFEDGLDQAEADQAAADFRYSKDLISAEDMEAWLEQRHITTEEWIEYIERQLLLKKYLDQIVEILIEFPIKDDDVQNLIFVDGVCSGFFGKITKRLAGRAAVSDALQSEEEKSDHLDFEKMETFFESFRSQVITPETVEQEIHSHILDWTKFELQCIYFSQEQMVREAVLCVKEDGSSLPEIAAQTKAKYWVNTLYLEDLEPDLHDSFAGSQVGDLLGPYPSDEGFVLYCVIEKIIPSVDNQSIRTRAGNNVLQKSIDSEINNRVKWHFDL
jgi:hypothetical protein